ncbi:hypothetical protein [Bradyrhizobium sp.]|jgi:uncharacterized membrane protein YccC|uniref:hypothetical protein n=1 Tax=Bradyrhizobium sp. TaxID=376 RepID=UPI002C997849|nr:hypothetical protein [Bradyrhizobium sp.]HWX61266.1 hypothetical protein [Bradyrhizobium sp.]
MSEMGEQDQVASQDPLNYAPRWLREKPEQRPAPSSELRAEREPKLESVGRAVQRTSTLDRQLESAVYESLRHSLDPEVMPEPPGFGRGQERKRFSSFASRVAVAIGVSAIVALFFVIMTPASRQPDAGSSLATTLENLTAAVARPSQADDGAKPALAEFKGLLAQPPEPSGQLANQQQSEQLLQQFRSWREKAGPNDPPQ